MKIKTLYNTKVSETASCSHVHWHCVKTHTHTHMVCESVDWSLGWFNQLIVVFSFPPQLCEWEEEHHHHLDRKNIVISILRGDTWEKFGIATHVLVCLQRTHIEEHWYNGSPKQWNCLIPVQLEEYHEIVVVQREHYAHEECSTGTHDVENTHHCQLWGRHCHHTCSIH